MLPRPTGGRTTWPPSASRSHYKARLVHAVEACYVAPMPDNVTMTMISIYRNPSDYPGLFVAREWHLLRTGGLSRGEVIAKGSSLSDARAPAMERGLTIMPRDPSDDRSLLETWI